MIIVIPTGASRASRLAQWRDRAPLARDPSTARGEGAALRSG